MEDTERIKIAMEMGKKAHWGKTWAAGLDYSVHLERVDQNIVKYLGGSVSFEILEALRAAAWLHDAVEDTGMQLDTIEQSCGPTVRCLVWAVTDEPGANRSERHTKTYPKIRNVPYATALKLADRITNVETSSQSRGGYFDMYAKEHPVFKKELYKKGTTYEGMWNHLDGLLAPEPSKRTVKISDKLVAEVIRHVVLPAEAQEAIRNRIASVLQVELDRDETKPGPIIDSRP